MPERTCTIPNDDLTIRDNGEAHHVAVTPPPLNDLNAATTLLLLTHREIVLLFDLVKIVVDASSL